jgi:hypothetical protein
MVAVSPSSSSLRLAKPDSSSDDPVVDAYNCRRLPPRPPIPRYPSHGLARFSPQRLRRPRLLSSPIGTPCTGAHTTTGGSELRTSPRSASRSRQSHHLSQRGQQTAEIKLVFRRGTETRVPPHTYSRRRHQSWETLGEIVNN